MISLCMIVKNEAHCLGRCLNSVHNHVDEIIIVDTGSEDSTVDIAQQYGAKVFHFPWRHDFAAARNFSLEQARGQWILYLDADEELEAPPENCSLRALTERSDVDAYYFDIKNFSDNDELVRHINIRLFRNNPHYRFEGRLHEQILDAIMQATPQAVVVHSGLSILHYGYLSEEWTVKDKASRNLQILEMMLKEQPNNPFYLYNLANTLVSLNNLSKAAEIYQRALKNANVKHHYVPSLFLAHISCLIKLGKLKKAHHYLEQCQQYYPDYPDIHFLAGELYQRLGLTGRSKACFEKCLQIGENKKYTTKAGTGSYLPMFQLARLYQSQEQYDQAIHYQLLGIKTKGTDHDQMVQLAKLLNENGSRQIPHILRQLLGENSAHRLAAILIDAKQYHQALQILMELPDQTDTRHWTGICYFATGDFGQAIDQFSKLPADCRHYHQSRLYLIFSCWSLTPPQDAARYIEQVAGDRYPLAALSATNDLLLNRTEQPAVDDDLLAKLINQILAFDNPTLAIKILQARGLEHAIQQIAFLTRPPISDQALELAAKLALTQLKTGAGHPDYYYLMAYYFHSNNEPTLAQQMIARALEKQQASHYRKLQKDIYRQQLQNIVAQAADSYPDNKQLLEQLLELYSGEADH